MPAPRGNKNASKKVRMTDYLHMRLSEEQKEEWQEDADAAGMDLSVWIRSILKRSRKCKQCSKQR